MNNGQCNDGKLCYFSSFILVKIKKLQYDEEGCIVSICVTFSIYLVFVPFHLSMGLGTCCTNFCKSDHKFSAQHLICVFIYFFVKCIHVTIQWKCLCKDADVVLFIMSIVFFFCAYAILRSSSLVSTFDSQATPISTKKKR